MNYRIQGEYWLEEDGTPRFADQEAGEVGHTGIALDHARRELISLAGAPESESDFIDEDSLTECAQLVASDTERPEPETFSEAIQSLQTIALEDFPEDVEDSGGESYLQALAQCAAGKSDERAFAIEHWGWKWVKNNSIASHTLTTTDRECIAKGIEEILFEEGADDEVNPTLHLSCQKSGKTYSLTLDELKRRDPLQEEPLSHLTTPAQVKDLDKALTHPHYHSKTQGD